MNRLILLSFVFFGLYGLKINGLPMPLFYMSLPFITMVLLAKKLVTSPIVNISRLSGGALAVFMFLGILLLYMYIVSMLGDGSEMSLVISVFVLIVFFVCVWGLSSQLRNFDMVVDLLFILISLQALLILLSFVSASFRTMVDVVIEKSYSDVSSGNWRLRGVSNLGGSSLSIMQGIGFLCGVYKLINNTRQTVVVIMLCVVILLSIMATGKSGFICVPVGLFMLILSALLTGKVSRSVFYSFVVVITIVPLLLFMFYQIYINYLQINTVWGSDALYAIFRRASGEYIEIAVSGKSRTLDYLVYSFNLPSSFSVLMFGDPDSWSLSRYSGRHIGDSGYLRILWGAGFLGSILIYGLWSLLFVVTFRQLKAINSKILVFSIYLWLLVMQFKEPYLLLPPFFLVSCLLMFSTLHEVNKRDSWPIPIEN